MTFAGESRAINNAADLTGGTADYSLAYDIVYRGAYDDAHGSSRALAGGEWVAWVRPFYDYLEPGDDAVLSWVVEVESGSVTVTAGEGLDPDSTDPFRPADTALGTFTLSAGANVIPSTITAATLIATTDDLMLRLSPVSGSAVVSQVKLRVWPPGGPVGGWATGDAYDVPTAPSKRRVASASTVDTGTFTSSDPAAAWDAGTSALVTGASDTAWRQASSPSSTAVVDAQADALLNVGVVDIVPTVYGSRGTATLIASVIAQPNPDPIALGSFLSHTDGGIRPPDEVPGDPAMLTFVGGASPSVSWGGPLTVDSNYSVLRADGLGGTASLVVADVSAVGYSDEYLTNITSLTIPLSGPGGSLSVGSTQTFALPGGSTAVMVAVSHPLPLAVLPYPGELTTYGGHVIVSGSLPDSVVSVPAFTYWSPTVTPRGIVRHYPRDDGVRGSSPKRHGGHRGSYQAGRQLGYQ